MAGAYRGREDRVPPGIEVRRDSRPDRPGQHGGLVVVDWKRSKAMYRDYPYQVAAYAEAVRMITGQKCEAWVCRLPQGDEAYEAKRVRDYDDALNAFLLALGLDIAVAKEVW